MKKLFTILALVITITTFAQSPQGFNYQATVRNNTGQLLLNQIVLVKFNILQNSEAGTIVYSENQTANTDDLGHINLVVGQGTATTGSFSSINWGTGTYYLGIELNTGSGYVAMGTTQLLSVPYALYANNSGTSTTPGLSSVLTANNSANSTKIVNLGDPVNSKDAVNKDYVDAKILELQNLINTLPFTDIDGNTYKTVKICDQIWMQQNLNVTHYRNGDEIPQVTDPTQWSNLTTGAWCYYANNTANGFVCGKMYNWFAVNDPRGLAPEGWHIPTGIEWDILANCLGGLSVAGGKMKEAGTAHWLSPNTGATNSSGFKGRPGGQRNYFGNFETFQVGSWWTSDGSGNFGFQRTVFYDAMNIMGSGLGTGTGLNVRCVKD